MNVKETLEHYDLFDNAIVSHGFTDYLRDYRVVAELGFGGGPPGIFALLFRGCAKAEYKLRPAADSFSIDDVFVDYDRWEVAGDLRASCGASSGLMLTPAGRTLTILPARSHGRGC
jgi:hypothetical protein